MNPTPTTPWYKVNSDYLHTALSGTYLVQIQVDRGESLLQTNQIGQYDSLQVII